MADQSCPHIFGLPFIFTRVRLSVNLWGSYANSPVFRASFPLEYATLDPMCTYYNSGCPLYGPFWPHLHFQIQILIQFQWSLGLQFCSRQILTVHHLLVSPELVETKFFVKLLTCRVSNSTRLVSVVSK